MTAINVVSQPERGLVHILQDAAIYTKDMGVVAFGTKSYPVAHWPGIVAGAGNCNAVPALGTALSQGCDFDHVIDSAPTILPLLVEPCAWVGGAEMLLIGISKSRGPEAYNFRLDDSLPPGVTIEEAEASPYWAEQPGMLTKLPNVIMTPPTDNAIAASYEGIDPNESPEQVIWSMRKHLMMQRHMTLPPGMGIGGFGTLTTISVRGIEQRIVDRWPDKIGAHFDPGVIDWDQWHRDNPKPTARPLASIHPLRAANDT